MQVAVIPVTPFQQNCSVLWCERTKRAAVIDPGGDLERVQRLLDDEGLTLERILITHGHVDHAAATAELARRTGVPVEGPHEADAFWIDQLGEHARNYGFAVGEPFVPTRWLHEGDEVRVGDEILKVHHCPGHTPGHVVFHAPQIDRAFVGDVLFAGSIGRTDFPQGNHQQLIDSITQRLWPMGNQTVFIPGHGPESTFGRERQSNPYVGGT